MTMSARTKTEITFSARVGRAPEGVVFAPGRIVLLGEHVDHQGGAVLSVPQARGVYAAFGVRPDRRVMLNAWNAGGTDAFTHDQWTRSGRRWADLARGACARLGRGRRLPGLDLVVGGDLPARRGLASSAAYVVAILKAVCAATRTERSPADLARDAAAIEAEWAGVRCGTMDGYTAAVGAPGDVVHLDCARLEHERLALPDGVELVDEDSGVERRLSETPYERRIQELAAGLTGVRARAPQTTSLVAVAPEDVERLTTGLPAAHARRVRHVVTEVDRVRRAAAALRAGHAALVGRLMLEGHRSLSRDFESSLPAIDARVVALATQPGVLGARLQGAGWGGSIAVLRRKDVEAPGDGAVGDGAGDEEPAPSER
jgi:galactokinase